ncbi:MAG TPA: hypothetical protein ENI69_11225 [Rhodospirillales bacterium]|nr:hypothetical protein [Rhodospirillales bacterium]
MNARRSREILFEIHPGTGRAVRVVAIDPASGTEVIMVGDSKLSTEMLKRSAARKLMYVLDKKKSDPKS